MEKQRLADQALEKSKQGIPLSRAEKSALARTNFTGASGELIKGSEIIRTIERQEEFLKAQPALTSLLQRGVPTTRPEFLTSLFGRLGAEVTPIKESLVVRREGRKPVQIISKGREELIARGRPTEELGFFPEFLERISPEPKEFQRDALEQLDPKNLEPITDLLSVEKKEVPTKKEAQIQRLKKLSERIKRVEEARKKIGLEEGIERIRDFSRFITGGKPSFISGVTTVGIGFPFLVADVLTRIPGITLKTGALGAGLIIEDTRELTLEESERAFREGTVRALKDTVTSPEEIGAVLTAAAIPAVFRLTPKLTPKGKAKAILRRAAEEKPPDIIAQRFFGEKVIKSELKGERIATTKGDITILPEAIVTTKAKFKVPEPTIIVGKGKGLTGVTLKTGEQLTTRVIDLRGKKFFIRSRTDPLRETVTKVFTEKDVLLKEFKSLQEPAFKFTEPIEVLKRQDLITAREFKREITSRLQSAQAIRAAKLKKFDVVGARALVQRDFLQAEAILPKTKRITKPIIDLETGTFGLETISFEAIPTTFKFVDFPVKQKPLTLVRTGQELFISSPLITKLTQVTTARDIFRIEFVKKRKGVARESPIVEEVRKSSNKFLDRIEKTDIFEIPKTKKVILKPKVETIQIQRPGEITQLPQDFQFFIPELEFVPKTRTPLVPISAAFISKQELNLQNLLESVQQPKIIEDVFIETQTKQEKGTLQEMFLESQTKQEKVTLQETFLESQAKQEKQLSEKVFQEVRLESKTIQKQQQLLRQELKQLTQQEAFISADVFGRQVTDISFDIPKADLPPPLFTRLPTTRDFLKPQRPGYDVFVRRGEKRGDRFIKAADNLPFNRAVGRGSDLVDNFIEASFKILKSGKKTNMIETFFPNLSKFRQPKGKTKLTQDVFVEKRKHRLDSIGEVAQISFFKEQARKKKEGSFLPSLNNLLFDTSKSARLRL